MKQERTVFMIACVLGLFISVEALAAPAVMCPEEGAVSGGGVGSGTGGGSGGGALYSLSKASGGVMFKDFTDSKDLAHYSITGEPGVAARINVVIGVGSMNAKLVVKDSKGSIVYSSSGVEVKTKTFLFTADGTVDSVPAAVREAMTQSTCHGAVPDCWTHYTQVLKAGEVYSVQGSVDGSENWFRMSMDKQIRY